MTASRQIVTETNFTLAAQGPSTDDNTPADPTPETRLRVELDGLIGADRALLGIGLAIKRLLGPLPPPALLPGRSAA